MSGQVCNCDPLLDGQEWQHHPTCNCNLPADMRCIHEWEQVDISTDWPSEPIWVWACIYCGRWSA